MAAASVAAVGAANVAAAGATGAAVGAANVAAVVAANVAAVLLALPGLFLLKISLFSRNLEGWVIFCLTIAPHNKDDIIDTKYPSLTSSAEAAAAVGAADVAAVGAAVGAVGATVGAAAAVGVAVGAMYTVVSINKYVPSRLIVNVSINTFNFKQNGVILRVLQHRSGIGTSMSESGQILVGSTGCEPGLAGAALCALFFLPFCFFSVLHGSAFGVREKLATGYVVFQTDKPP